MRRGDAMRGAAYDLILLDLMLPDGRGIGFLKALRARGDVTPGDHPDRARPGLGPDRGAERRRRRLSREALRPRRAFRPDRLGRPALRGQPEPDHHPRRARHRPRGAQHPPRRQARPADGPRMGAVRGLPRRARASSCPRRSWKRSSTPSTPRWRATPSRSTSAACARSSGSASSRPSAAWAIGWARHEAAAQPSGAAGAVARRSADAPVDRGRHRDGGDPAARDGRGLRLAPCRRPRSASCRWPSSISSGARMRASPSGSRRSGRTTSSSPTSSATPRGASCCNRTPPIPRCSRPMGRAGLPPDRDPRLYNEDGPAGDDPDHRGRAAGAPRDGRARNPDGPRPAASGRDPARLAAIVLAVRASLAPLRRFREQARGAQCPGSVARARGRLAVRDRSAGRHPEQPSGAAEGVPSRPSAALPPTPRTNCGRRLPGAIAQAQRLQSETRDPAAEARRPRSRQTLKRLTRLSEQLMQLARAEGGRLRTGDPSRLATDSWPCRGRFRKVGQARTGSTW